MTRTCMPNACSHAICVSRFGTTTSVKEKCRTTMRNGLKLSYASTRAKTCIEGRTYKGGYMRKYKVKSTKLCSERSVVRHLRAVAAFGVACTYLMSGSVSAQNANNPPTPDGSSVYLIAKVQGEKNEISNDIDQASAKRDALTAKETQAETERDDIDHKARLFNDSPKSQQLLKEIASYRATDRKSVV